MDKTVLSAQIRQYILKNFPLARQKSLQDTDSLLESGIIDSMGILELVNFIEEELQVEVTDEELLPENFQSISSLVSFLQSKRTEVETLNPEE